MVLIGISLMISDVEPLDICWPSVCSRLQKNVFRFTVHFFIDFKLCEFFIYFGY